jgi:hypothetical protein
LKYCSFAVGFQGSEQSAQHEPVAIADTQCATYGQHGLQLIQLIVAYKPKLQAAGLEAATDAARHSSKT